MTQATKRCMAGRIWPADRQFDTLVYAIVLCTLKTLCSMHLSCNKIYSVSHSKCNSHFVQGLLRTL